MPKCYPHWKFQAEEESKKKGFWRKLTSVLLILNSLIVDTFLEV